MNISIISREVHGELNLFIKTVGKIYINVAFIKFLSVHKTKRKGYLVKAWLDSVKGDCFILAQNFKSEDDAKKFIHWLVDCLNLEKANDTDEENSSCEWEFNNWRREKWRENHILKPGKISLMKPLF